MPGVAYLTLKPWSERGKGQDLLSLFVGLNKAMEGVMDARVLVVPPPPIQGVGNASGATMQLELRDGSFDFTKLQTLSNAMVEAASSQSSFQRVMGTFRSDAPQYRIDVDRVKAQTLHVNVDQVFSTIQTFMGSTYVVQFNKFGRTFQAYVQADAQFRLRPEDITQLTVRNSQGQTVPIGTLASVEPADRPAADQPVQSLSDRDRHRHSGAGRVVGPGDGADGADRVADAAGHRLRMDRAVLSGEARRQSDVSGVRARHPARLSGARRTI
jgi:HAE1 family hydrophobic/amphiphilic exporter-1